jgi:hypothetical protein
MSERRKRKNTKHEDDDYREEYDSFSKRKKTMGRIPTVRRILAKVLGLGWIRTEIESFQCPKTT